MFLDPKEFKKLMTKAYKGSGLLIGRSLSDHYVIEGQYWSAWIRPEFMPKQTKALIMEFAGEYPSTGQFLRCYQKAATQYELLPCWEMQEEMDSVQVKMGNLIVESIYGMYRMGSTADGQIVSIPEQAWLAVSDPTESDYNAGEYDAGFPEYTEGKIIWENNVCHFMVYDQRGNEDELERLRQELQKGQVKP